MLPARRGDRDPENSTPTLLSPASAGGKGGAVAAQCFAGRALGGGRDGPPAGIGAAENVQGRGRVSGPTEEWPRLRRLHPVPPAPLLPGGAGGHQPEWLVQVLRFA